MDNSFHPSSLLDVQGSNCMRTFVFDEDHNNSCSSLGIERSRNISCNKTEEEGKAGIDKYDMEDNSCSSLGIERSRNISCNITEVEGKAGIDKYDMEEDRKGLWFPNEEAVILEHVRKDGPRDWGLIKSIRSYSLAREILSSSVVQQS